VYSGYREFFTIDEAREWGKLHFGDWLPKYQASGFQCGNICADELLLYLGHGHRAINNELRNDYYLQYMDISEDARSRRRLSAQRITELISQRTIKDNVILYRFVDTIPHLVSMVEGKSKKLKIGSTLIENGFLSTSLVYESLLEAMHGTILLRLLCPKGIRGAYVDLISRRAREQEVLLPPGTAFIIKKIYRNKDKCKVFECLITEQERF